MRADLDAYILPSASALGAAFKCIGSALGPQTRKEQDDKMAKGTADHKDVALWIDCGFPEVDDPRMGYVQKTLNQLESDELRYGYKTELELSLDPDVPELILGDMLSVDRSRFFIGACDLAIIPKDGTQRCAVIDWKTGAVKADKPQWNWQLIHAALAVWVAGGMDPQFVCDMAIAYIDGPHKDEPVIHFRADGAFLASRLSQLAQLKARLLTWDIDNARLTEGAHCSFCRVKDRCPAKTKALMTLASAMTGGVTEGEMVQAFLIAREKYDRLETAATSIVESRGQVLLPNGNVAKMTKWGKGFTIGQTSYHKVTDANEGEQTSLEDHDGHGRKTKEAVEASPVHDPASDGSPTGD